MTKTVISTFSSRDSAERAVNDLRSKGFDKDISILSKGDHQGDDMNKGDRDATATMGGGSLTRGTATGSILGGAAGLAASAGALTIPGIGPIVAAGPIAALLSGAVTGGIAGGLVDLGIPENRGHYFEDKVKQGNTLVSVRSDDKRVNEAAGVLRSYGSSDVEIH
ncbi:MAG: hypothetical protein XD78_2109 [Desulfotomaculum sp. 46_296]|nr:MAG: hypothetical protein XD78_2109 [Desulfotomaculum sp. 46_296]